MDGYKVKTKAFLKHVKNSGGILTIIAKRMGVDRSTLFYWLNRNPTFWEYVFQEREQIVDIAESKLINKLNSDEDWAIKFILGSTNRGKRRGYSSEYSIDNKEGPSYIFEVINPNGPTHQVDSQPKAT
jgi:hypothetical protein